MQSKIFLIEDDSAIRDSISLLLESVHLSAQTFSSAKRALEMVRQGSAPDLVITDLKMPGLSGIELIRELRDTGLICPCILLTGVMSSKEIGVGDLESVFVLKKPVDPDRLLATIDEILRTD